MKPALRLLLAFPTLLLPWCSVLAQGTAFTYQGRLNDGANPANGTYDLLFLIYEAPTGPGIFANVFNYSTPVTNGLFTVTLDFGTGMFSGAERWLEIGVRTNGGSGFTTLSPRQKITATPYAVTAGNLTGVVPSTGLAGTYSGAVTFNNPANSFSGNGGGMTNVNALTLSGLEAGSFWQVGGNNASPLAFLGTTNTQALEFRVNNTRGLRIEPTGGAPSLVGGYFQNTAGGPGAVVAGGGASGSINEAAGMYAFVGSGLGNMNRATASVIVGGSNNVIQADSDASVIGGGVLNIIRGASQYSTIGGGIRNAVQDGAYYSTIDGGTLNEIGGNAAFSAIGGGIQNRIQESAFYSAIGGGVFHTIQTNAPWSTIGGGYFNVIQPYASYSTIDGGKSNVIQANSIYGTIAGGQQNNIGSDSEGTTIGGGLVNRIDSNARSSSIGGGSENSIGAYSGMSTIAGGQGNHVGLFADGAGVLGGTFNAIGMSARLSLIGGGIHNTNEASRAMIGGGEGNAITPSGSASVIGGGTFNKVQSGADAFIGGGQSNVVAGDYALVCGGWGNAIQAAANGSVIGGGFVNLIDDYAILSVIGGGDGNWALGIENTIGGGIGNRTGGSYATVSGGGNNAAIDFGATVTGGAENTASGLYAAVGGGFQNTASGQRATVPGGNYNTAAGDLSFAAGFRAKANHTGSFVWADVQNVDFASTAGNQFSIRAAGGVRLNTDTSLFFGNTSKSMLSTNQGGSIELGDSTASATTPYIDFHYGVGVNQDANVRIINDGNEQLTIARAGSAVAMGQFSPAGLTVNGAVVLTSDRNRKENFQPVDAGEVLAKVAALPLTKWNYKEDTGSTHIGPMAQDFYAAFAVGPDDKHIATVDADGVALAAIQGLNQKVEQQKGQLKQRDLEIAELRQRLDQLEKRFSNRTTAAPGEPNEADHGNSKGKQ